MPELPEVETIVRELRRPLIGAKIRAVDIRLLKIVKAPAAAFRRRLIGTSVTGVDRRAKLILLRLQSGWTVVIHLKMSGQLIWRPGFGRLVVGGHPIPGGIEGLPNRYSHVIIRTDRGTLFFNDQRQFGFVKIVASSALAAWLQALGYGPEPLEPEFTEATFLALLRRHAKKRIKPTLLDQTVIAGIGNIYADESCHYARIRPQRKIQTLRIDERRRLYRGIRHVMRLSIRHRGTSADAYRRANGEKGGMMPFLRVYGRAGLVCRRGRGTIVRTVLAGRGTHWCPTCQR